MSYKGIFLPINIQKYNGNTKNITYRSLYELGLMKWLDENPDIISWSSEEIVIPYVCKTDNKIHRYFIDFYVKFKSGKVLLIEIKPIKQTKKPESKKGKSKTTLMEENITYIKNLSKWMAAKKYAEERGWEFNIWTEKTLIKLGIKIINYRAGNKK